MNEIEERAHYAVNCLHDFKDPYTYLFNMMPKRWQTYARDLYHKFGFTWGDAVTDTFVHGCRSYVWIRIDENGERRYRSIYVKVSNRGHIYLE